MVSMTVRWSAIRAWRKCQYMYFNRYIRQIEHRRPAVPLIRGTILGECLDQLAAKKKITPVLNKYEKEYGKLFNAEKEEYGDLIPECKRIVLNYKQVYKDDGLTYLKGEDGNPYEIEVYTEFKVGEINVKFQGHIDKLPHEEKRDLIFVMDHKSHKVIPDSNTRFSDLQLLTYNWLLPISNVKIKADGVIWDYLCTKPPTVPELLKNGTLTRRQNLVSDPATYLQAIKDHGLDPADYQEELARLKITAEGKYFDRVYLPAPSKDLINQVVKEFKETIVQIHDVTKRKAFVRNMTRECHRCSYYNLCSAELRGLDTDFILKSEYVIIEGDPHHGTKKRIMSAKEIQRGY